MIAPEQRHTSGHGGGGEVGAIGSEEHDRHGPMLARLDGDQGHDRQVAPSLAW